MAGRWEPFGKTLSDAPSGCPIEPMFDTEALRLPEQAVPGSAILA